MIETHQNGRPYRTSPEHRRIARDRRNLLRSIGRCINGPTEDRPGIDGVIHGPALRGGRCQRCADARRGS